MPRYLNPESDFEYINGKKCLKDGKVLRVHVTTMDSASKVMRDYTRDQTMRVTDGDTGDPLWAHKPGWRNYHDAGMRQLLADERALDCADYLTDKDTDFANANPSWSSTPPTSQGAQRNVPGVEDIPEGTSCTINGWPGKWKRVNGAMTCIPNNKRSLDCYELYDLQIADQWRGPTTVGAPVVEDGAAAWRGNARVGPNLRKELGEREEDDDEEQNDDDEDENSDDEFLRRAFQQGTVEQAYRETSTHTEGTIRRDVPDRLAVDHAKRMKDLAPTLRRWSVERRQIADLQRHREKIVDAAYSAYDSELGQAWRIK